MNEAQKTPNRRYAMVLWWFYRTKIFVEKKWKKIIFIWSIDCDFLFVKINKFYVNAHSHHHDMMMMMNATNTDRSANVWLSECVSGIEINSLIFPFASIASPPSIPHIVAVQSIIGNYVQLQQLLLLWNGILYVAAESCQLGALRVFKLVIWWI